MTYTCSVLWFKVIELCKRIIFSRSVQLSLFGLCCRGRDGGGTREDPSMLVRRKRLEYYSNFTLIAQLLRSLYRSRVSFAVSTFIPSVSEVLVPLLLLTSTPSRESRYVPLWTGWLQSPTSSSSSLPSSLRPRYHCESFVSQAITPSSKRSSSLLSLVGISWWQSKFMTCDLLLGYFVTIRHCWRDTSPKGSGWVL